MKGPSRVRGAIAVGTILAGTVASIPLVWMFDGLLAAAGRADLRRFSAEAIPYIVAFASSSTVGAVLAIRRPANPVGWLFLALGGTIAVAGLLDAYALYGAVARPGSLPAADLAAVVGSSLFVPWFVLIAWILHLTPTGSALSDRWRLLAIATTWVGAFWMLTALVWPGTLERRWTGCAAPWPFPRASRRL